MPKYSNLMIMGDFDLHIHEENSSISDLKDSLFAMCLEQHVNFGAHIGGNILDLIIKEVVAGIKVHLCEPGVFISDHCVVKITIDINIESIRVKQLRVGTSKILIMWQSGYLSDIADIAINYDM